MPGLEIAVVYLIAWATSKARRVGQRADGEVDKFIDLTMDRLHEVVKNKIGDDSAFLQLEHDAFAGVEDPLTKMRVTLSLEDAVRHDSDFAKEIEDLLKKLRDSDRNTVFTQTNTARGAGTVNAVQGGNQYNYSADHNESEL